MILFFVCRHGALISVFYWLCRDSWPLSRLSPQIEDDNLGQLTIGVEFCVSLEREGLYGSIKPLLDGATHTSQLHLRQFVLPPSLSFSARNVSPTSLCSSVDESRRRPASHHLFHLDHSPLFPLHARPAVRSSLDPA